MEPFSTKKMAGKGSLMGLFATIGALVAGKACGYFPCTEIPGAEEGIVGGVVFGLVSLVNWGKQKLKGR